MLVPGDAASRGGRTDPGGDGLGRVDQRCHHSDGLLEKNKKYIYIYTIYRFRDLEVIFVLI